MRNDNRDDGAHSRSGKVKGIVQSVGSSSIPREFITPGDDIDSALGRTIFRDETQKNVYNQYYSQLKLYFDDDDDEIHQYRHLLNSAAAIEGKNREQALEGYTGVLRDLQSMLSNKDKRKREKVEYPPYREGEPIVKEND